MDSSTQDPQPAVPSEGPPTDPPLPARSRDRSYLVIGAWTLGLLVVGAIFFRYSGGGGNTAPAPPPSAPLVPPTRLDKPRTGASSQANMEAAIARVQEAALAAAKAKVKVVPHKEASYRDATYEHLAGYVQNDSDRTVKSWRATVRFYDVSNKLIDSASKGSEKPIAPGTMEAFTIDHIHLPLAKRASMMLEDVEFK